MQNFSRFFSSVLGVGATERTSYHGASSSCNFLNQQLELPEPACRYTGEQPAAVMIQGESGSIQLAPELLAPIIPPGSSPNTPASLSQSHFLMARNESSSYSMSSSQPKFNVAEWPKLSRAASQADLLRDEVAKDPSRRSSCNMSLINDGEMYFGDSPSCFSTSSFAFTQELPSFFHGAPRSASLNGSLQRTLQHVDLAWSVSQAEDDRVFHDLLDLLSPQPSPMYPPPRVLVPDSDTVQEMDEV
jgi:hypothetical protein